MGYHLREIPKGVYGELSKIEEELLELKDAEEQGIKVMAAVEMADIYGALEAYAEKNGLTMEDLKKMSDVTKKAFKDGSRESGPTSDISSFDPNRWEGLVGEAYIKRPVITGTLSFNEDPYPSGNYPSGARPWP